MVSRHLCSLFILSEIHTYNYYGKFLVLLQSVIGSNFMALLKYVMHVTLDDIITAHEIVLKDYFQNVN